MFHLGGLPSYLVLAELAVRRVLCGELPAPGYPVALRQRAREVWWKRADRRSATRGHPTLAYGRLTQCVSLVAQAVSQSAHAVLAARGEWITNEKPCLPAPACARSTSSWPPLNQHPTACATWWTDPTPLAWMCATG